MYRWLPVLLLAACSETSLSAARIGVDPPECPDPVARESVERDETCRGEPEIGSFTPVKQWSWTANAAHPGYHQIMAAPVVGFLDDGDSDGIIGSAGDMASVVFTAFAGGAYTQPGALVALRGDTGAERWSIVEAGGYRPMGSGGVAIADLGDGDPVVLVSSPGGLLAVEGDTGAFRWHAAVPNHRNGAAAVADIDGDGMAEVVYGRSVINHDGSVRWTAPSGGTGGYFSFAMDLDADGTAEIVAGNTVYEHDGTVRWTNGTDGYPAVGDMDLDGEPEVVTVSLGEVHVHRASDGEVLWGAPITDGGGGPPTIADFDGDGLPEVGVASRAVYWVFDHDGTPLWSNVVSDGSSYRTGSSVFDFEGDGAAEVVYADQETLFVWDGATGTEELRVDEHSSGTLFEFPLVVDVDSDGSAEIVLSSNDYSGYKGSRGITVWQDRDDSWAPARRVWNQYAWSISNVFDDGGVPEGAPGNWRRWNSFRAGNSETAVGLGLPNLRVGDPEMCDLNCGTLEEVEAWVPIENAGAATAEAFFVAIRSAADGSMLLLERVEGLDAGRAVWVGPVTLTAADGASGGITVEIDADDEVEECDESDNEGVVGEHACD